MAEKVLDPEHGKVVKERGGLVIATMAPQDCAAVEAAAAAGMRKLADEAAAAAAKKEEPAGAAEGLAGQAAIANAVGK